MSAPPDKILELVETFERNLDHYKDGKYNETQLRIEFLDPSRASCQEILSDFLREQIPAKFP